jgi:predicted DNA-binding transcriptional regulator AlpA
VPLDLVATPEIAQMLGVSRQRADVITKQMGFPSPVAELSIGRVWSKSDVERWIATSGRPSNGRSAPGAN